jgi:hypothetical protein
LFIGTETCNQGSFKNLGYDLTNFNNACQEYVTKPVYMDTTSIYSATILSKDISLIVPADIGWYSEGILLSGNSRAYYWNGTNLNIFDWCIQN